MRGFLNMLLLVAAAAPFVMPPGAIVADEKAEGGGWRQGGTMPFSFRQTCAQFASRFSAAGWRHKHTIPIAKMRAVEAWERGGEVLTLMVWREAPDRTGFSWGISSARDGGMGEYRAERKKSEKGK